MKDDRVYFEFARAFAPAWLARFISLTTLGIVAIVLIAFVIVMKVMG